MTNPKTYFNWSNGKDSALALYYILQKQEYSIKYLLTSVNSHFNRVSIHSLRTELLEKQLQMIGIPNGFIARPEAPTNKIYEKIMGEKVTQLKSERFEYAAFGDIFLQDLRTNKEKQLNQFKIKSTFPLWKKDARELTHEFIDLEFKSIMVSANATFLAKSFSGRIIDRQFIRDLPKSVDICGGNGEFRTFCFDALYFKNAVNFTIGNTVKKEYQLANETHAFWFCDLQLNSTI